MEMPSRRSMLLGVSGAAAASLLSLNGSVSAMAPAQAGEELFLIGPYNLGVWWENGKLEFDSLTKLGKPGQEAILESLKKCNIYIVDKRIHPAGGTTKFPEADFPQVAVTGPYKHEWKKDFFLEVNDIKIPGVDTDYTKASATRHFSVVVKFATAIEAGNIIIGPIDYDIDGNGK